MNMWCQSSCAGSGPAAAFAVDIATLVPGEGVLVRLLGGEGGRSQACQILLVALGVGLLLVHFPLEVGEVGLVEEGVALDRYGRATATLSAAFVALSGLIFVVDLIVEIADDAVSRPPAKQRDHIWPLGVKW